MSTSEETPVAPEVEKPAVEEVAQEAVEKTDALPENVDPADVATDDEVCA